MGPSIAGGPPITHHVLSIIPMSYRNLDIWKLARGLVADIHKMSLTRLPKLEMFEEGTQIRRSMKSVRSLANPNNPGTSSAGRARHSVRAVVCQAKPGAHGVMRPTPHAVEAECATDHLETLFETGSLADEVLFKDLSKRLDELGRKINLFTQTVEASHRTGPTEAIARIPYPASHIQHPASRPRP